MESYVIRILHRDRRNPKKIAGVVEGIGEDKGVRFFSFDALWKILASAGKRPPGERRSSSSKKKTDEEFKTFAEIMELIREEQEYSGK